MRVIGGELSGRRLLAPSGSATRPTSDKVREAIFNRLAHGALGNGDPFATPVLDLYAGSGSLGIEALSRGATRCDFVDSAGSACAVIKKNLEALALVARARVTQTPVDVFLRRERVGGYGLVFADPPYADAGAPVDRALTKLDGLLVPGALVIVEHGDHAAPSTEQASLSLLDQRSYGQTMISFFAWKGRGISSSE